MTVTSVYILSDFPFLYMKNCILIISISIICLYYQVGADIHICMLRREFFISRNSRDR